MFPKSSTDWSSTLKSVAHLELILCTLWKRDQWGLCSHAATRGSITQFRGSSMQFHGSCIQFHGSSIQFVDPAYSSMNPAYSTVGPALSLKYYLSLTVILIVVFRFLVDSYSTQTTGALSPGPSWASPSCPSWVRHVFHICGCLYYQNIGNCFLFIISYIIFNLFLIRKFQSFPVMFQ